MNKKVKLSLIIGLGIVVIVSIVLVVLLLVFLSFASKGSDYKSGGAFNIKQISPSDLENKLNKQPIKIEKSYYKVQDEQYKSLYPDMLVVDLKNESNKDVKKVMVGFVAWDKNGLPIKIKGKIDFRPAYFKPVENEEVNMAANSNETYTFGIELDAHSEVESFKPIIMEYEDYDGKVWKNPDISAFEKIYVEKKLFDIKNYKELVYFKNQPTQS